MDIGARIAEIRKRSGLTQEELARETGLDRTALSKIERGKRQLLAIELARIAEVLERPVADFLSERKPPLTLGALRRRRKNIERICQKFGARAIRVFGSIARGEADGESDVDLLVELEPGRSLLDLGGLQVELSDFLGRNVDVVTDASLKERIRGRVLREAVAL